MDELLSASITVSSESFDTFGREKDKTVDIVFAEIFGPVDDEGQSMSVLKGKSMAVSSLW